MSNDLPQRFGPSSNGRSRRWTPRVAPRRAGPDLDLLPQRILLAEDDAEMRRMLADALRKDGYDVVEAESGHQLMELLTELFSRPPTCRPPYDLVISDHRLPGVTGLTVLHGLSREAFPPPFILITAFGGKEFEEEALATGATAVFDKPFEIDDLRTAVLNLIGRPWPER